MKVFMITSDTLPTGFIKAETREQALERFASRFVPPYSAERYYNERGFTCQEMSPKELMDYLLAIPFDEFSINPSFEF